MEGCGQHLGGSFLVVEVTSSKLEFETPQILLCDPSLDTGLYCNTGFQYYHIDIGVPARS